MADQERTINCVIGKWYFKRMTLLGLLLLGFGGWFLYDGAVGYPKGAVKAIIYEAFEAGSKKTWEEYSNDPTFNFSEVELTESELERVKDAHAAGGEKALWEDYARKKKIDLKEPAEGSENRAEFDAFTAGGQGGTWEAYSTGNSLAEDQIDTLFNAFEDGNKDREWKWYVAGKDLPTKKPHFHGKGDILEQYVIGSACALGGLTVLVLMLLNRAGAVSADAVAYYPKPNVKVPFEDVFKIDTRKWRRKGLAYAYYKAAGGVEKKAVLDDLKFVGSQEILDRMMASFEGELIEEVVEEEEAGEVASAAPEAPSADDETVSEGGK